MVQVGRLLKRQRRRAQQYSALRDRERFYHQCFYADPTLASSDTERVEAALRGQALLARAIDELNERTARGRSFSRRKEAGANYYIDPKRWPRLSAACIQWCRRHNQRLTARRLAKWFARIERGGCGACGRHPLEPDQALCRDCCT